MAKLPPTEFFKKYADYAMKTQNLFGVPASVTLAQAALESGWGGSSLTVMANNFFGIKDFPNDEWHAENYAISTGEYGSSGYYTIVAKFRKYKSPLDSFNDHASFLLKNSNYKKLFALDIKDYKGWCNGLKAAGYATAPNYGTTLITMIEKYGLTKYDDLAPKKKIGRLVILCVLFIGLCVGVSYYKKWLNEPKKIAFTILIGVLLGVLVNATLDFIEKKKFNL